MRMQRIKLASKFYDILLRIRQVWRKFLVSSERQPFVPRRASLPRSDGRLVMQMGGLGTRKLDLRWTPADGRRLRNFPERARRRRRVIVPGRGILKLLIHGVLVVYQTRESFVFSLPLCLYIRCLVGSIRVPPSAYDAMIP